MEGCAHLGHVHGQFPVLAVNPGEAIEDALRHRGDARAHHRAGRIDEPGTEDRDRGVGLHNVVEVVVDAEVVDRRADCRRGRRPARRGRRTGSGTTRGDPPGSCRGTGGRDRPGSARRPAAGWRPHRGVGRPRAWQRHAERDPDLGATRRDISEPRETLAVREHEVMDGRAGGVIVGVPGAWRPRE